MSAFLVISGYIIVLLIISAILWALEILLLGEEEQKGFLNERHCEKDMSLFGRHE